MQMQSERPAWGSDYEERARIDPTVYVTEGRRLQAQAMAETIGAGWRAVRWALNSLAAVVRRQLLERLAQHFARRRARGQLAALDDRLLADIGLRRGDIALAVDGLLADPRVARRAPGPAETVTERPLESERRQVPAASANSNRPAAGQDRVPDRAA